MSVDPDVIRRQIINQMKLAAEHLHTNNANEVLDFVKQHIIYPGEIIDKPMADLHALGDTFLKETAVKAIKGELKSQASRWTDANRWDKD